MKPPRCNPPIRPQHLDRPLPPRLPAGTQPTIERATGLPGVDFDRTGRVPARWFRLILVSGFRTESRSCKKLMGRRLGPYTVGGTGKAPLRRRPVPCRTPIPHSPRVVACRHLGLDRL